MAPIATAKELSGALHEALVDAFSTPSELEQFFRQQVGVNVAQVSVGGMGKVVFDLLVDVEARRSLDGLDALLWRALAVRPGNPKVQLVAQRRVDLQPGDGRWQVVLAAVQRLAKDALRTAMFEAAESFLRLTSMPRHEVIPFAEVDDERNSWRAAEFLGRLAGYPPRPQTGALWPAGVFLAWLARAPGRGAGDVSSLDEMRDLLAPYERAARAMPTETAAGGRTSQRPPHLMIVVKPEGDSVALTAWRGTPGGQDVRGVNPGEVPLRVARSGLGDAISRIKRHALPGLDPEDDKKLVVEFIVPHDHLHWVVEALELAMKPRNQPVGKVNPVVVRPYERVLAALKQLPDDELFEVARGWQRRWRLMRRHLAEANAADAIGRIARPEDATVGGLGALLEAEHRGCVVASIVEVPEELPRVGVEYGVPVVLWGRNASAAAKLAALTVATEEELDALPEKVRALRREGCDVALLWDDPELLPPLIDAPLVVA